MLFMVYESYFGIYTRGYYTNNELTESPTSIPFIASASNDDYRQYLDLFACSPFLEKGMVFVTTSSSITDCSTLEIAGPERTG